MKLGIKAVLAVTTVLAGTSMASAETLKEALAAAYASNPQLMAQRAALRATDEGVAAANAGFLPQVNGSGSFDRGARTIDDQGPGGGENVQDINSDAYSIQLNQNLFRGFQDRATRKQRLREADAGRAQLANIEQQVLLDAVTAYMNVLRDEAVVELNKNNVQVLERQLQASRDRFRVGEVTRTDVAQSEARLEGSKSTLLSAEATLAASRAQYQRVIGRPPSSLETPTEKPDLPLTMDEAIEIAIVESPNVEVARHNEDAARHSVNAAKGSLLPSVDLTYRYTHAEQIQNFGTLSFPIIADINSVNVQVSVPIFNGGLRHSNVRRAKQLRSQRRMEIHQAERVAQEQALVAWDNYRAAQGQILSNEAQVRANEIALEGVRQEAYVGSRTTLDVLNAEQELLNARVSLVRAQRDESVAAYSLVSSVGRLTARKIGLGVDLYDDRAYLEKVNGKFIGFGTEVK
ncbi:MAG: TolC family outer membrane protein [Kordiimonadaceae bacterium]|nr:TolC family outer membrane protein [Kordiimonadaceae bacterium]MBO6570578.1 TolC family outer membrane protein [Kordiimonadaceae bacterium]MBO6966564.1 TolC family outer membrane protein [Kordiimonadaceae bacterium]